MALTCGDNGSTASEVVEQINNNETDIASNTADTDSVSTRVTALEDKHKFYSVGESNILDIGEVYQPIASLAVNNMDAGTFMVGFSFTATFASTHSSIYYKMIINGVEEEFIHEPADITDREAYMYQFPTEWLSGDYAISLEAHKDSGGTTLNIEFANLWIDKKD